MEQITYTENIRPIFLNSCLNCHNADKKKAGLDLSSYQATMDGSDAGKVIEPGNAAQSQLWKLVTHAEEPVMPAKSDKLADSQLDLIRKWIEAGAPEKAGSGGAKQPPSTVLAPVAAAETRPSGPPPMPQDLLLEPVVKARQAGAIAALAASPWAPLIAVGGQRQVLLFNTDTLELAGILPFPEGFPDVLKFSRDGQLVLAGGGIGAKLGRVVVWNVTTGARVAEAGEEFDQVLAADLSPDHTLLALGGPSRLVKIFSARDGALLHKMKKHTDWVTALAFAPDGKTLVTGDRAGGLVVWDTEGRDLQTISAHQGAITSIVCVGNSVATASEDGKVKFWDVTEGKERKSWLAHQGGVTALAALPGGGFVSCGRDRVTRLWDANGNKVREFEPFHDVALQAAGGAGKIVAGDWTGALRVWTLEGQRVRDLDANPPTLAERVKAVTQRLAELQPQHDLILAQRKKLAEDAAKITQEAQAAQATLGARENELKTSEAQLVLLSQNTVRSGLAAQQSRLEWTRLEENTKLLAAAAVRAAEAQEAAKRDQPGNPQEPSAEEAEATRTLAEATTNANAAVMESQRLLIGTQQALAARTAAANAAQTQLDTGRKNADRLRSEFAELRKTLPGKIEQGKTVAAALSTAQKSEEATQQQLTAARAELAHWQAAQVNVALHAAQNELAERTAKKAPMPVAARQKVDQLARTYAALRQQENSAPPPTSAAPK